MPNEPERGFRATADIALFALAMALFSGFLQVMLGAQKGQVDSRTREEVQALIEKGMDNSWLLSAPRTEEQLKQRIHEVFAGTLAEDVYHRSVIYLNTPTDWPATKILSLQMVQRGKEIEAHVDFREVTPPETRQSRVTFHLRKTGAGWRIDRQKYEGD